MAIYFDSSMVGASLSEDLSVELAEYTALNTELEEVINGLPDAGSGGSSFKTCTLAPSSNMPYGWEYYLLTYTTVENGEIVVKKDINMSDKSYEPITVLCDTFIYYLYTEYFNEFSFTGGFREIISNHRDGIIIMAPSEHGVSGTFEISEQTLYHSNVVKR